MQYSFERHEIPGKIEITNEMLVENLLSQNRSESLHWDAIHINSESKDCTRHNLFIHASILILTV